MATGKDIMSDILDRLLDSLGLDEENRQRRIRCEKVSEFLHTWRAENICQGKCIPIYGGSSYETTTVDGLSSDIDILFVLTDCRVIQDIVHWNLAEDKATYMIDETDCYKSYGKLYELSPHYPGPIYNDMINKFPTTSVADEDGKLLFSSRSVIERMVSGQTFPESHGPALKTSLSFKLDADVVIALRCDFFPRSASRWKERQTPETVNRVGKHVISEANHCHIVPVGNKSSPNEHVEWRYSFTHIERKLVHLWNNTQYKLYIIMKFILKDLIEPQVPDVISSYHMKTIMFWMNEEYPRDFFKKSNLTYCLLKYLTNLLESVRRKSLPHYFIEECNLYYNKIDDRTSQQLMQVIQYLINEFPYSLFDIERRSLGYMLRHILSDVISVQTVCNFFESQIRESVKFNTIFSLCKALHQHESSKKCIAKVSTTQVELALQNLDEMLTKTGEKDNEIKEFIKFSQKDFACHFSIEFLIKKEKHPNIEDEASVISAVTNVQRYVNSCRINTRLKVAAFLVNTGDFQQGSVLLDRIERQMKPYAVHDCCHQNCESNFTIVHTTAVHDNEPTLDDFAKHYVAGVVEYSHDMIGHLPKALVYEMFRVTSVYPAISNQHGDFEWHKHTVIHCPVFMFFLRYVIAKARGLYAESKAAINNMKRTSKQPDIAIQLHSETNHNLIGYCQMELGDTPCAYKEYRQSLNFKKFDNAAIWHIALLLRRKLRDEK